MSPIPPGPTVRLPPVWRNPVVALESCQMIELPRFWVPVVVE